MAISELSAEWHGLPLYAWYGGAGVAGGSGLILYRRWRSRRAAASSGSSSVSNGTADMSNPLPGWSGLSDALGPLGGSSPSGALLGYTSDGTPVYSKGPTVAGDPANNTTTDVTNPGTSTVEHNNDVQYSVPPGETASLLERITAPVSAVVERILPSLEIAAPNPTPAATPVNVQPMALAGMPAGTPGVTAMGGYTVPSTWVDDIKSNLALSSGYSSPPADIRAADWNTGKPYTSDSPVADWQKYGFATEQQWQDAQALAAKATAAFSPSTTPGTYEWYQANPQDIYQTPFGPATKAQYELGHAQGRW